MVAMMAEIRKLARMNSSNTYWLCRAPGAGTEGPFSLGQLRKMYETGALTAEALVCREGQQDWYGIWGLWALVATALCVMQIGKGQGSRGVQNLLGVWILAPLMIGGLQFAVIAYIGSSVDRPEKPPAPVIQTAPVFTEPEASDPFETASLDLVKRRGRPRSVQRVRSEGDAVSKTVWVEFERANGPHIWRLVYKGNVLQSIYSDREGDIDL